MKKESAYVEKHEVLNVEYEAESDEEFELVIFMQFWLRVKQEKTLFLVIFLHISIVQVMH